MSQTIGAGLIAYEKSIWSTADTLRGAGIKESEFPSYMMPFFAWGMLESRLLRLRAEKIAEFERVLGKAFDQNDQQDIAWLDAAIKHAGKGYNSELVQHGKGIKDVCLVPGANFLNRLISHLNHYDPESQRLLGVGYASGTAKFLDLQGKASDLFSRPNSPLYAFAQKWATVDLIDLDNSEITTIEEHIKRKWADISAETAGEQYTPTDIIDLANAIVGELLRENGYGAGIADVYDMACGGGNFVYALESAMRQAFPDLSIRVRGQELNDTLFALASIEGRFRPDAHIEWGNTLTNDLFLADKFDAIVANPPYGVDWKDFKSQVESDASGRFSKTRLPPTSDGQLLFLQHAAFHLADKGVAAIVHSGSTLFSGDAGGGESETRRWLLQDLDIVEAIIQLPKNEFFNTGIATYLWVLNKGKPASRKGKVLLINAESCSTKLQKNLNKKNCEINPENRERILEAFRAFADGPISKALSVDDLLYNKVDIEITRQDENGKSASLVPLGDVSDCTLNVGGKPFVFGTEGFCVSVPSMGMGGIPDGARAATIPSAKEMEAELKAALKEADGDIELILGTGIWTQDQESNEIFCNGKSLGVGVISVKPKVSKGKGLESLRLLIQIEPLKEKDTETIPYSSDPKANEAGILAFLAKWVKEPAGVLWLNKEDQKKGLPGLTKVGAEINFNRIFPKKAEIRSAKDILADIRALDQEMERLIEQSASEGDSQ